VVRRWGEPDRNVVTRGKDGDPGGETLGKALTPSEGGGDAADVNALEVRDENELSSFRA